MSEEIKTLVSLITSMHNEQSESSRRTDDHLSHLRDTMHTLVNDMTGVAALTNMMQTNINELRLKQKEDISELHGHINRETVELAGKIAKLETAVNIIAPRSETFGKIMDNLGRAVAVVLVGAMVAILAMTYKP